MASTSGMHYSQVAQSKSIKSIGTRYHMLKDSGIFNYYFLPQSISPDHIANLSSASSRTPPKTVKIIPVCSTRESRDRTNKKRRATASRTTACYRLWVRSRLMVYKMQNETKLAKTGVQPPMMYVALREKLDNRRIMP
jgi:hypothetical protein